MLKQDSGSSVVGDTARPRSVARRLERILIVEDEKLLRWSLKERLSSEGYRVVEAMSGTEARAALEAGFIDLVLLDFKLPDTNGIELLREIRERSDEITVILMTAFSSIENAVAAMRMGAYTYLTKPFDIDGLIATIEKALEATKLHREVARMREHQQLEFGLENIIAGSPAMKRVFTAVLKVAQSPATTVLITGESGVGKDLIAKAIHYRSSRAAQPFMNVTCTTITETLLESQLFGHEKGAFTDAKTSKKGLFEIADGGTVFLDEIGDMPPVLQAKLLRFLQEKTFKRVGGTEDVTVDVRIIAATNKDLEKLVRDGVFREDLYYRLNVIPLPIPPLRERSGDVRLIAQAMVSQYNKLFRKSVKGITEDAITLLESYPWPGNVRELKNFIERTMILGDGEWIRAEDLPYDFAKQIAGAQGPKLEPPGAAGAIAGDGAETFVLPQAGLNIDELEKSFIIQALRRAKGVKTKAGALLGLNRDQIRYRMEKYGIHYGEGD